MALICFQCRQVQYPLSMISSLMSVRKNVNHLPITFLSVTFIFITSCSLQRVHTRKAMITLSYMLLVFTFSCVNYAFIFIICQIADTLFICGKLYYAQDKLLCELYIYLHHARELTAACSHAESYDNIQGDNSKGYMLHVFIFSRGNCIYMWKAIQRLG